jgi:hypothetical protein
MPDKVKKLQERICSQIPAFLIHSPILSTNQPVVQFVFLYTLLIKNVDILMKEAT